MRTVQMMFDNSLIDGVDKVAKKLKTTRSAFTREALKSAINHYYTKQMENKHRKGYKKQPIQKGEFDIWEDEQQWDAK